MDSHPTSGGEQPTFARSVPPRAPTCTREVFGGPTLLALWRSLADGARATRVGYLRRCLLDGMPSSERWTPHPFRMSSRSLVDSDGVQWTVREVILPVDERRPGTPLPAGTTGIQQQYQTWLYFEREGETRRLTPLPDDWEEAADAQLRWWLTRAKPLQKGVK